MTGAMLRSLAMAVLVSGCALYTGVPDPDEPAATSHVVELDIPQITSAPLDVLVIVDSSTQMAPVRDHVLASLPAIGDAIAAIEGPIDLRFGVITADPEDGGRLRGAVVTAVAFADGTHARSYTGTLGATLVTLADAGATAATSAPLEMMQHALDPAVNPGFRRADATLLVVIVTAGDDDSLGAVADYAAALPATRTYVAAIAPHPATRLDAFVAAFPPYQTTWTAIGDDYATAIRIQYAFHDLLALYCFDAQPTGECAIEDVVDGASTSIPACDASGARPCWRVHEHVGCTFAPHLTLEVLRHDYPPPSDHVMGQCVVAN